MIRDVTIVNIYVPKAFPRTRNNWILQYCPFKMDRQWIETSDTETKGIVKKENYELRLFKTRNK
jgi:hypothetical protein